MDKLANLDRRILFLLVTVFAIVPLIWPLALPVSTTPEVKSIYDKIESLPERSVFLLSMDFDPASAPELFPMAKAVLRHAFKKNLRVIGVSLWPSGKGLLLQAFDEVSQEYGRENGKDFVVLGVQTGGYAVVIALSSSIRATFREDAYQKPTADMEVLKGVSSLKDIAYQVELQAGEPGIGSWYYFGKMKCGYELGAGTTAVGAPEWYPFLQTKQLNGLLGGMRGGAEYEQLVGAPDRAMKAMDPLSTTHVLVILCVLFGNVMYFLTRKKGK